MNERLNSILKHFKISSSQFADEIGVQRSSVSHVLSGRNRPGFDFIQRILMKFPEINAEWLITGAGEMLKKLSAREKELFETDDDIQKDLEKDEKSGRKELKKGISSNTLDIEQEKEKRKQIDKIIIVYKDKTFEEYNPT
ncbi:MAG: hypothetical protein AMS27_05235 [Bacteroides sp. SM23_62_1]|nr:MAG: hypothetical protein AMS27_05235 [Bacteroides sp. SM23_62_1]